MTESPMRLMPRSRLGRSFKSSFGSELSDPFEAMMDRFFAIMLTLIGAAALGLLFIVVAHAHGVEQWIANQQLSDPELRTYCCGPSDCHQLSDGAVIETEDGYLVPVVQGQEFVAAKRALPFAPDGHYHACYRYDDPQHNTVRCLIVPPPSS
jgi:hypothetical protein